MKTPSQDAQGHWYELLSGTKQQENEVIQPSILKVKLPRNRKLQRYCRKLRKQGLDEATIQMYKRSNQLSQQQQQQQHNQVNDIEMEDIIPLNDITVSVNLCMNFHICLLRSYNLIMIIFFRHYQVHIILSIF